MNTNRTKYASTPTYGMSKRGFSKKSNIPQAPAEPDFSQTPEQPVVPFSGAPNPFQIPQNVMPTNTQPPMPSAFSSFPQTTGAYPPVNPTQFSPMSPTGSFLPPMSQPATYASAPSTGFSPMGGNSGFQSIGNMQQPSMNGFSPRQQGFVPPKVTRPADTYQQPMMGMPVNQPMNNLFNGMPPMNAGVSPMNNGLPQMNAGMPQMNNGMPPLNAGMPQMNQGASGLPPMNNNMPQGTGFPPYPPQMNPNGFQQMPYPTNAPKPKQPFDAEKFIKIYLFVFLPLLFIPCLFVPHSMDFLRYAFIVLTVLGLGVMWYRQSFGSNLRTIISIVGVAMCIVSIGFLLGGNRDVTRTSADASQPAAQESAAPQDAVLADTAVPDETPAPTDNGASEAQGRLTTFMELWKGMQIEDMVSMVQPSWATTKESPSTTLFNIISNRTPTDYTIEDISGNDADSSRTVTMTATIDKNNGKDPVRYRFMILMVKESGEWYIDPNSLATNDVEATDASAEATTNESGTQTMAPRMTVTPVPDPSTKLYWNANGGKYYHADPECSAVNKKYLPLASFLYSELGSSPYNSLQPCLKCGAPTKAAD